MDLFCAARRQYIHGSFFARPEHEINLRFSQLSLEEELTKCRAGGAQINIVAVFGRERTGFVGISRFLYAKGEGGIPVKGRGGGGETQRQHRSGPYARNAYTRMRTQRGVYKGGEATHKKRQSTHRRNKGVCDEIERKVIETYSVFSFFLFPPTETHQDAVQAHPRRRPRRTRRR